MYEVTIKKSFSAAHLLKEIGGKCEELHGIISSSRSRSRPNRSTTKVC